MEAPPDNAQLLSDCSPYVKFAKLDEMLLSGPFSAGARKCPGSRVAGLEVRAFLSRLVQDWRFELVDAPTKIRYYQGTTITPSPMPRFRFHARK